MPFTAGEVAYLRSQSLGRLATISGAGSPHRVPVRFARNAGPGTIDSTGRELSRSGKYRDSQANHRSACVVDDIPACSPPACRRPEIRVEADAPPPANSIDARRGACRTAGATLAHEGGRR